MSARLFLVSALILSAATASADEPSFRLGVQGALSGPGGPSVDGEYGVVFSLYASEAAEESLWSETNVALQVTDGLFSDELGDETPLSGAVTASAASLWLGITIGSNDELPRRPVLSVVHALSAANIACSGCVQLTELDTDVATQAELDAASGAQAAALDAHLISGDHDDRYVNVSGDTVTGDLTVDGTLDAKTTLKIGTSLSCSGCVAEAGLGFDTATQAELDAAIEAFVSANGATGDAAIAALAAHAISGDHDDRYVNLAGDTMTGDLRAANIARLIWSVKDGGTYQLQEIFDDARNNGLLWGLYDCVLRTTNQSHWRGFRFTAAINSYTAQTNAGYPHRYHGIQSVDAGPSGCSGGLSSLSGSGTLMFTQGNCFQQLNLHCTRLD